MPRDHETDFHEQRLCQQTADGRSYDDGRSHQRDPLVERKSFQLAAYQVNAETARQVCIDERVNKHMQKLPGARDLAGSDQDQNDDRNGEIDPEEGERAVCFCRGHGDDFSKVPLRKTLIIWIASWPASFISPITFSYSVPYSTCLVASDTHISPQ